VRGLQGVQLIISDAHTGLQAARKVIFGGIPWQRCQFHLQRNAQAYVPRKSMLTEVHDDIRTIFNAPNRDTAESWLARTVEKYATNVPKLADWMEANIPEGLTVFSFPREHQRRLRTANPLERLNQEIKRRTRIVRIFPNEASCLRLISAILMEKSEDWLTGRRYLSFQGASSSMLMR
jgi:transposase-like protein